MNIAISGLDRVALEQHVPAILATPGIELIATASPHRGLDGVPWYPTLEELLASESGVDSVALCSPAPVRLEQARLSLESGRHVMLERPAHVTLTGLGSLIEVAQRTRLTLLAAWPARFGAAVQPARELVAARGITAVRVSWSEDAARWAPEWNWAWDPGGLGVFHRGIDALSILTRLVPERLTVTAATFWVPSNRAVPVAAELTLTGLSGMEVQARLDGQPGLAPRSDIEVQAMDGTVVLGGNGSTLLCDGRPVALRPSLPYRGLYQHFLHLAETGACDLDVVPLMQVADACVLARRVAADAFITGGD